MWCCRTSCRLCWSATRARTLALPRCVSRRGSSTTPLRWRGWRTSWSTCSSSGYHFIVSEPKLHDALDRFASFFSCPLFSESGTDREIKAVDSENNKNLQDDDRREYQLLRSTCEQDHPMARFGTGNEETLRHPAGGKIDVRAELLKLHKGVYSANLMTLAVIGNVTLDKLEEDVREMFGTIVNREVEETRDWARRSPFGAAWRKAFLILPVAERRRVSLLFPSPPLAPEYKSKPHQLLSHLLGHEGPGSLLAVLKAQGWATELYAGPGTSLPNESVFGVTVCLTEEGLPKWRDVIQMVFHYVHIMRKSSFEDRLRIWNEVNITQELDFRFRDKEKEDGYVERIALSMAELPDDALPENLLTADALFLEPFDDRVNDKVDRLIDDHLKADNLRIHLSAPRDEIPRDWFASEEEATRSLEAVDRVSPPVPAEDGAGSEEGAAGAATVGGEGGEEAAQ
ncbi:Metalloenzyme, LuxS/M16 peptidase-like protein, partial [Baffinella frigidus]